MSDSGCLFCKIAKKQVPTTIVYEDDYIMAFRDIVPQKPIHIVLIPKIHITSLNEITIESSTLIGHMVLTARDLAVKEGISVGGYRLVSNCGPDAGQSIGHLHFHLLGGAPMLGSLA